MNNSVETCNKTGLRLQNDAVKRISSVKNLSKLNAVDMGCVFKQADCLDSILSIVQGSILFKIAFYASFLTDCELLCSLRVI